ncbi:MAG: SET domain-containing protein [Candidatus Komeilibacteria bacterium]|nr:SET domain-containing protein [Candidatus Komeilibacteria bacterium]
MAKNKNFHPDVKIKKSSSGLGLYCMRDFSRGEKVIEYVGKIISNKEADRKAGRYLFDLGNRYTLDGSTRQNIARYINHSCRSNCDAYRDGYTIYIEAKRKLKSGEEITFNYGREYFDEYINPRGCKCDYCRKRGGS